MIEALESPEDGPSVPARFVLALRAEIPAAATDAVTAVREAVPEFDRPPESSYDEILALTAVNVIGAFVDRLGGAVNPAEPGATCRAVGHFEAIEGRGLDAVETALRVAAHASWRRLAVVAEREGVASSVIAGLAESLLTFMDETVAAARAGHREALAGVALRHREQRRRLLGLLLQGPPPPPGMVEEVARDADWWPLPDEATVVAVQPGAQCTLAFLEGDVLIDLKGAQPCLLVPGPLTGDRRAMLAATLAGTRSVLGLTLPLGRAQDGMRWAARVLALVRQGMVRDGTLISCDDHLMTVWLLSDPALMEELERRHLAPLAGMSAPHRRKLIDTLTELMITRGSAAEVGEKLHVHPQTVRYRLRQLATYFGPELADSEIRFRLDVTLRAAALRRRRSVH